MLRWIALGLLACLVLPHATATPAQVHASEVDSRIVVQWALAGDARGLPPGRVDWGATASYGASVAGEMVGYVDGTPYVGFSSASTARDLTEAPATLFRARLPAMGPGTAFHYRVVDGVGDASRDFTLATLPGRDSPVRLVAYADQGTYEDGKIGPPAYRPGDIVDLALAQEPDLAIVAGDLSYAEEGALRWWNQWFDIVEPLAATRPFYAAVGNHDRDFVTGYDHWQKRFTFPRDEQNYAFDAGPVHVLVVNSQEACLEGETTETVQRVNPNCTATTAAGAPVENTAITDFMRRDLADARARGVPWLVVVFHHPPYAHGGYNETNAGGSYMWWLRENWIPILEEHGVDVVLTGHDHNYQRSWPMLANETTTTSGARYREGEGVVYVVTGGGGRNTYSLSAEVPWWLATGARAHHVTVVDATAKKLDVVVKDLAGQTLDAFTIRKSPASQQNAAPLWLAMAAVGGLLLRRAKRS